MVDANFVKEDTPNVELFPRGIATFLNKSQPSSEVSSYWKHIIPVP